MKQIVAFLFIVFILFLGRAQSHIRFKNYSITSGLSQSFVNSIVQDDVGFVWIGTQDGLNKFDGYRFEVYNAERIDNLSGNYFYCSYKDDSGLLWFGTEKSLLRYDYKTDRFEAFAIPEQFSKGSSFIAAISQDVDGEILVLMNQAGIVKFLKDEKVFQSASKSFNDPKWTYMKMLPNLGLFAFSSNKGLVLKTKQKERFLWMPPNLESFGGVVQVFQISASKILVVGKKSHVVIDLLSGQVQEFYVHLENWSQTLEITDAHLNEKKILYLTTASAGLYEVHLNEFFQVAMVVSHREDIFQNNTLLSDLTSKIYQDNQGYLWVGTQRGASVFNPEYVGILGYGPSANLNFGLPVPSVWSFAQSPSKSYMFIGHSAGVSRLDVLGKTFNHFYRNPVIAGRFSADVPALAVTPIADDRLLVGCTDGLYLLEFELSDPGNYRYAKIPHDLLYFADYDRVYSILKLNDGNYWVGTKGGLALLNLEGMQFNYPQSGQTPVAIKHLIKTKKGNFWGATNAGEVFQFFYDSTRYQIETKWAAFNSQLTKKIKGSINVIHKGNTDYLWLGTFGSGLFRVNLNNNEIDVFDTKRGLPNSVIYGILEDRNKHLWLSTNKGLSKFDPETEGVVNFTEKDGLMSDEFNTGAFFKSENGEMYFGGIFGFNHFFPESLKETKTDIRIFITDFRVSGRSVHPDSDNHILALPASLTREVRLNYADRNIYFRFATSDLANAELIEFRYILDGNDDDYNFIGHDNFINFPSLSPGVYTLKIFAKSTYGEWSQTPLVLKVSVVPPFWITWWFRLTSIGVVLLVFISMYRYRVEQQRRQMVRLEMRIMERTQEIRTQNKRIAEQNKQIEIQKREVEEKSLMLKEEKEKVEKLLHNILPEDTVRELSEMGTTRARAFKQVSVMFTDFSGFTKAAERIEPIDLIDRLDMFFSHFDGIIEKWNLEKIKTVGDAYLCAGGMPIRSKENPIKTVLAGLEIQQFIRQQAKRDEDVGVRPWSLRVGINTGEVVAGVIGKKRYAYDIWGSTVNLAQRMEVNCKPGAVNISEATFEIIEPYFICTPRGKVMAKNSGLVNMYFVERIKPELSADEDGIVPNEQFWKIVHLHLFSAINYAKAERFIHALLAKKLPKNLHYHSIFHTKDVTTAAERIAIREGITDEDLFLLKSAASYHDAGFINQYDNNEPLGIALAKEHLPKFGYSHAQLERIEALICVTKIPHQPVNQLEEIMCDADLDYLGRDDFWEISDKLRRELREHGKINSDRKWDEIQVSFFEKHRYFTQTSIALRQEQKMKHLQEIKARLEINDYKD